MDMFLWGAIDTSLYCIVDWLIGLGCSEDPLKHIKIQITLGFFQVEKFGDPKKILQKSLSMVDFPIVWSLSIINN